LLAVAAAANLPAVQIGVVGGDRIRVSVEGVRVLDESLASAERIWSTAIEHYFERRRAVA
jgi:phosphoribosylformylglycinamidine synthase